MQGWIEGFQESIDFIEQNLTEELDIENIANDPWGRGQGFIFFEIGVDTEESCMEGR